MSPTHTRTSSTFLLLHFIRPFLTTLFMVFLFISLFPFPSFCHFICLFLSQPLTHPIPDLDLLLSSLCSCFTFPLFVSFLFMLYFSFPFCHLRNTNVNFRTFSLIPFSLPTVSPLCVHSSSSSLLKCAFYAFYVSLSFITSLPCIPLNFLVNRSFPYLFSLPSFVSLPPFTAGL